MGVIISQMRIAIGALMWLPFPNSIPLSAAASCGAAEPIRTPPTMHSATQRVRYRSNVLSRFFMSVVGEVRDPGARSGNGRALHRRETTIYVQAYR